MSKERDDAVHAVAAAFLSGEATALERSRHVVDAILAAVRAEREPEKKAPCGMCGDARFICDSQAPPGGADRHGQIGCSHIECACNRRPCPDCSAAPAAEDEVAKLRAQAENDEHVIRLQNDRNVELQGEVAKLRARVAELEREERNGWPRTRAALKTRAGECVVDAACRVEQELAQANAKVKELEDGYPLRELRTVLGIGIGGTQESLMTAATRIMGELAQARQDEAKWREAWEKADARINKLVMELAQAKERVTELEAKLAEAENVRLLDALEKAEKLGKVAGLRWVTQSFCSPHSFDLTGRAIREEADRLERELTKEGKT